MKWHNCTNYCTYTSNKLNKTDSFLRMWQLIRKSTKVRHSMSPAVSWPSSQQPATRPYPEPDQSNPVPISFLKDPIYYFFLSKPRSPKLLLSLTYPHQNHVQSPVTCSRNLSRLSCWWSYQQNIS